MSKPNQPPTKGNLVKRPTAEQLPQRRATSDELYALNDVISAFAAERNVQGARGLSDDEYDYLLNEATHAAADALFSGTVEI
jgi:hypothetical protein